jgi:transcriptional regulator with XRE-family HTH domain
MSQNRQLGNRIRRIRELRNVTQEYMAQRLGISQSNYARMESNEVSIPEGRLLQIAEILETTTEAIRKFDDALIFNITQGDHSSAGQHVTVNHYHISPELQKLYEDKIRLLEEKIIFLETQAGYGRKEGRLENLQGR